MALRFLMEVAPEGLHRHAVPIMRIPNIRLPSRRDFTPGSSALCVACPYPCLSLRVGP